MTQPLEPTGTDLGARPSVAILVDDLISWIVAGVQPTGIQRVVSELVETAYECPHIDAWAAVAPRVTGGMSSVREVSRESLRLAARRDADDARLRALRNAGRLGSRILLPASLRRTAKSAYTRLVFATGGMRAPVSGRQRAADLILVPGAFWFGGYADRIGSLAKRGRPVRVVVYDLFPVRNPEWVDSEFGREFTRGLDAIAPLADRIVTMSRLVAAQVAERYPETRDRIRVGVPAIWAHGLRTGARVGGFGGPVAPVVGGSGAVIGHSTALPVVAQPFLLAVSTVEPRKNHRAIIDAWRLAKHDPRLADASLVIAGRHGWMADDIEAEIARAAERLQIVRLDHATDDEITALYDRCSATVHASWAEGFGLPVRESIAQGIPTLVSTAIPLDGLTGDTYTLFDPRDTSRLSELMVNAVVTGHVRAPIPTGEGTGWEPMLSALID
jgi:glycosyltransferase involved in cell wall biosynthesis